MYMGKRGALTVDLNLLNDVIEQNGGGAEPLKSGMMQFDDNPTQSTRGIISHH